MNPEWERWLIGIALAVIAFLLQRWIKSEQDAQKEREQALWRELRRLSKNYHDLKELSRRQGLLIIKLHEHCNLPSTVSLEEEKKNQSED